MQFISYEFLAFFVGAVCLYYLIPGKLQWLLLLTASLFFYVCSGPRYVTYILFTTAVIYLSAIWMEGYRGKERMRLQKLFGEDKKARKKALKKKLKRILAAGVGLNISIFAVVKYSNFAIWNVNWFFTSLEISRKLPYTDFILPLGISYYTLQALGYLLDVFHEKEQAERNPFRLLLFLSFFPQVVQGPISRFGQLKQTLFVEHRFSWDICRMGIWRILWGFYKKLVVADRIAPVVIAIGQNPDEYRGIYVLVGMLAYTLQLYGDFTGGIDIAIGCAQVLGVTLPENFNSPFGAGSLAEYWRRWHMTLMQWFREYVFYPLAAKGAPNIVKKCVKRIGGKKMLSRLPVYQASLITWFLTGIWHGASWNFVVWGMVNCAILLISQDLEPVWRNIHKRFPFTNTNGYHIFSMLRTLMLVSTVQMFEYYPTPITAVRMFGQMFLGIGPIKISAEHIAAFQVGMADVMILLFSVCLFVYVGHIHSKCGVRKWLEGKNGCVRFSMGFALFLMVLIFGIYGQGYDASQFIYNQF